MSSIQNSLNTICYMCIIKEIKKILPKYGKLQEEPFEDDED